LSFTFCILIMSLYVTRQINTPEKRIFWMLIGALLCTFLLYGYFVQLSIQAILQRSETAREVKELNVALGELESEYNTERTTLTYARARLLGFSEPEKRSFATRIQLSQRDEVIR